ncbi:N-terminal glutamine amidase-domain-containing protein [Syncephalis plumigaleata]|nr:N-terminal glutamine amidase-domain-containing protein [Syncephalis plumigaleata]
MTILTRDACQYTKQYCEENIYLLAKQLLAVKPESKTSVVFISNKRRAVPLWGQAASKDDSTLVVWDYHVILIEYTSSGCMVYDFDAILPFPCSWNEYMSMVFRPDITLAEDFQRQFRVVSAIDYIGHFSSDRSHMVRLERQVVSLLC